MTISYIRMTGLGVCSLAMLTACQFYQGPVFDFESHQKIDVGSNQVFVADVKEEQFNYWILDETGIVENQELLQLGGGSVTVNTDAAAGLYVTTPTYTSAPNYTVKFDGSVNAEAVFSYLDTDEMGFEELRNGTNPGNPGAMWDKHLAMVDAGAQIKANWELDRQLQSKNLTTVTHEEFTGAQSNLQDGIVILVDSNDLEAAEAGTSGLASWAIDVENEMALIEPQALADTNQALSEADGILANAPDPVALQQAIEDCLELEDWGDAIEAKLYKDFPADAEDQDVDGIADYDGKVAGSDRLRPEWERLESSLESYTEDQELIAADIEACVEMAIGGEPTVDYTETDPAPYELIGANVTALGEGVQANVEVYLNTMVSDWSDAMEGEASIAWGALGWMDPANAATALIEAEVGNEMLAESAAGVQANNVSKMAMPKADSSFSACSDVTPVFEINLVGLSVVVGTPFDDTIRGADVANGFEVMWGGPG